MPADIPQLQKDFPGLMRGYRERAGWSRNALAHEVGVDPSYLTRIEHGDREPPRQHIIEALARALKLTPNEHNRLLTAAGYSAAAIVQLGSWDDALEAVTGVLNDKGLTPERRDAFRDVICQISTAWGWRSIS